MPNYKLCCPLCSVLCCVVFYSALHFITLYYDSFFLPTCQVSSCRGSISVSISNTKTVDSKWRTGVRYLIAVRTSAIFNISPGELSPIDFLPFEVGRLGLGVKFDAIQVFVLSHNYDMVVEITLSLQPVGRAETTCGQYSHQEGIIIV